MRLKRYGWHCHGPTFGYHDQRPEWRMVRVNRIVSAADDLFISRGHSLGGCNLWCWRNKHLTLDCVEVYPTTVTFNVCLRKSSHWWVLMFSWRLRRDLAFVRAWMTWQIDSIGRFYSFLIYSIYRHAGKLLRMNTHLEDKIDVDVYICIEENKTILNNQISYFWKRKENTNTWKHE